MAESMEVDAPVQSTKETPENKKDEDLNVISFESK
jgi:hypothetical protein